MTGTWKIWHSSSRGLDRYALAYLSDVVMVNTMAANLEREAKEWVTRLHDEDALELGNIDTFLEELKPRLNDESQAIQAEVEI